ncbi:hypothetical protein, unlikely [Trypanosoma congolense IL3000]|uniref:Uncharacterized protein n=1 Tax=Trypanosoma congolense (strain IL3000) TaxID=1068625 RepID=F9W3R9_TRYCI|nr:hypothetical protein, unlikely [Trypanosoma congolense IL3000]
MASGRDVCASAIPSARQRGIIISTANPHNEEKEKAKRMPSAKLIVRFRHSNFQPVRDKQLSASVYRRPFQSQSRMEQAALRQKGSKAATAATQRFGPFSHASQQNPNEKRKEGNGSAEGREFYSNEATAPTAVPQHSCSDTRPHTRT